MFCIGSEVQGNFEPEDLNLTDEALRLKYLGPQQMELFVPISAVYLLIFVAGTVGNGLTCTVILRHKAMGTPTNFYLLSLAVSDLLVLLVGLPLELYEMQHNYPFQLGAGGCYFRTLLFETVCLASVLNVTALSVERYVAVVHPLQAKSVMTRTHVRRMLGAIWILAVLFSLPNTSLHGLKQLYVPCRGLVPDSALCTLVRPRLLQLGDPDHHPALLLPAHGHHQCAVPAHWAAAAEGEDAASRGGQRQENSSGPEDLQQTASTSRKGPETGDKDAM